MKYAVSHKIALGAMRMIADGAGSADFSAFGISVEDYKLFTGEKAWINNNRVVVTRVLEVLLYGVMDIIGTNRFPISAEYLAGCIAMFVNPANVMPCCAWAARPQTNASLIEEEGSLGSEQCTAPQLFSLVQMCLQDNPVEYKARFEKRTGINTKGG